MWVNNVNVGLAFQPGEVGISSVATCFRKRHHTCTVYDLMSQGIIFKYVFSEQVYAGIKCSETLSQLMMMFYKSLSGCTESKRGTR